MKVFLSHSSQDKKEVRRIKAALAPHDAALWLDEREILPGDSLIGKIGSAITDSDCVLAFISRSSMDSKWVQRELLAFQAREDAATRPLIILVMLDDAPPPPLLADRLQVRTVGRSLGVVVQQILRGIFRTHAVVLATPDPKAPQQLEPFRADIEEFKREAAEGALHVVYDWYALGDLLISIGQDPRRDVDTGTASEVIVPRVFEFIAALSPRLIQVVLECFRGDAAGAAQAERTIQLVWRMVFVTLMNTFGFIGNTLDDRPLREHRTPFDLVPAVDEWRALRDSPMFAEVSQNPRTVLWLERQGVDVKACRYLKFLGAPMGDGRNFRYVPFVYVQKQFLRSVDRSDIPEIDFMSYQWAVGVLPHLVTEGVIDVAYAGLAVKTTAPTLGLRPGDFERYTRHS